MSEAKIRVVVELVVTDREVASYIKRTVVTDPTTWSNGSVTNLSEAVADFLVESIGPSYPDDDFNPEAESFFDRYHAGDWLKSSRIKIEGGT